MYLNLKKNLVFFILLILLSSCTKREAPDEKIIQARSKLNSLGVEFNEESFLNKVIEGDEVSVKLFLEAQMNPNLEINFSEWLNKNKRVPNIPDNEHVPVLFFARTFGKPEIERLLISFGADSEKEKQVRERLEITAKKFIKLNSILKDALEDQDSVLPEFMLKPKLFPKTTDISQPDSNKKNTEDNTKKALTKDGLTAKDTAKNTNVKELPPKSSTKSVREALKDL